VLSPYVEQLYARELLADQAGGVGYLLKDRVFNDDQFVDAIRTVAGGGTVMDPEVVTKQAHDQHLHQARAGIVGDDNRRLLAVRAYLNA
jgi:DNA-binding NarL/FixJ family response regulator